MILLEDVSFTSKGKIWTAPAGSVIDGASIPRFFWRVIGSPFIGYYRRASVVSMSIAKFKHNLLKKHTICF